MLQTVAHFVTFLAAPFRLSPNRPLSLLLSGLDRPFTRHYEGLFCNSGAAPFFSSQLLLLYDVSPFFFRVLWG